MIVDGSEDWYMSAEKYVGPAMNSVEINLAKSNQCLPTHCKTSIISDYFPETETSPKLKAEGVTQYQYMVGILRWSVEMIRVEILLETALVSTYLALSCRRYLEYLFHMFGYLKANPKKKLCFGPHHPKVDGRSFDAHNWYDLY